MPKKIMEIIANKELFKVFTEKISKETSMFLRKIVVTSGVNSETLHKIFMSNYASP